MTRGVSFWRGPGAPRAFVLGLALLAGARVASVWPDLPDRMASHFDASGRPNGWMSRDGFFEFMAVFGGGTSALLLLMPLLLSALPPELINLPNRDYWFADERRSESIARLASFMAWFGFATAALIALVLELSIQANLRRSALDNAAFVTGLLIYALALLALSVALFRSFRLPRGVR